MRYYRFKNILKNDLKKSKSILFYLFGILIFALAGGLYTSGINEELFGTNRIIVKHNILTKYAILYGLLSSVVFLSILYYFLRGKAIEIIAIWKLSFGAFGVIIYLNLGLLNNYYDNSNGKVIKTKLITPTRLIYSKELIRRNSCVEIENPLVPNEAISKLFFCYRKPWEGWKGKEILPYAKPNTKVAITIKEGYFGAKWISSVKFY